MLKKLYTFLLIAGFFPLLQLIQFRLAELIGIQELFQRLIISSTISAILFWMVFRKFIWLKSPENDANAALPETSDPDRLVQVTREMKKHIYDLHNLFEISVNLTSILDYERLVSSYLLSIVGQLRSIGAMLLYPSKDNWKVFRPLHFKGFPIEIINNISISVYHPLFKRFHNKAVPINLQDDVLISGQDKLLHKWCYQGISLLAPLMHKNRIMGIIAVGKKMSGEPYSQTEVEMLSLMTNMASVGISNAKLYHEMEMISVTDELTNLYNYRFLKKQLNDEISRAQRFNHVLSLVLFDVDYFKHYNDSLGHPAGDKVLQEIGKLLKTSVRQSDIVSRYGGEEFCAILPEVNVDGAYHFSERFRRQIEQHPFYNEYVQPNGKLTISVGAACFPRDAKSENELLEKADKALYKAKDAGKNRVCLFSDTVYATD
ncbi:diguanylate cyclase [candidate division KSB1 bacterium]|nr:diguanylate cyclase [candidate division KSB1 bacterium]